MKNFKALLLVALLSFSFGAMANGWGFYNSNNYRYDTTSIKPQKNTNGYNKFNIKQKKVNLFGRVKNGVKNLRDTMRLNRMKRRDHRWARKSAYYECLRTGKTAKQCRLLKKDQRKLDRASRKDDRVAARKARRAERRAARREKRIRRRLARVVKRRDKLLAKLNGN
jgi:hypothetical protein